MSIKCVIVDDEPLAIELLETHIAAVPELELVATCQNGIEALTELRKHHVDLIFLDIQMPQLNGIEFVKTLKNSPKIIIVSAYQEYAFEAFQIDAVDYLLKPVTFEQFLSSVNKMLDRSFFKVSSTTSEVDSHIYVKSKRKMLKVKLDAIQYIESDGDSIRIVTNSDTTFANQKISTMEDKLPGDQFIRVHRSFIVGLKYIKSYSSTEIELQNGKIPIGRSYKELIEHRLRE